jgi:colicin import membrane protein
VLVAQHALKMSLVATTHYQGHRPRVGAPRRVGGGYDLRDAADAAAEVARLQHELDQLREDKENAVRQAKSTEAAGRRARESNQQYADALALAHAQLSQLGSQLQAAQAALAERGLGLDAAYQKQAALEARVQADETAHRAAERAADDAARAADDAKRDAAAAAARAAELEQQAAALSAALSKKTSEAERLAAAGRALQQKEALVSQLAEERRIQLRHASDESEHRAVSIAHARLSIATPA